MFGMKFERNVIDVDDRDDDCQCFDIEREDAHTHIDQNRYLYAQNETNNNV